MMAQNTTRNRIAKVLLSKSRRATYARVFAVLALCVAFGVALALHQNGVAMVHKERVLTCPVTQTVAHTHNEDCYDADGNLVCSLPELELHTHTDECYAEKRELTCGKEESEEHTHTEDCYTVTRELTCDKDEITEEHVHGPGCFTIIEVPNDTSAPEMPAQGFVGELKDQDDKVILRVEVEAPEGAFPANTTMEISALDANDVKAAADEAVAQRTDGKVLDIQAVDIVFKNEAGEEIEPAKDVTVRFVSDLIAESKNSYVIHMGDDGKGSVVDPLTDEQLAERNQQQASEDELYIDTSQFSPYVLVTVSFRTTLVASDGKTYTVTVDCPAEAAVPQDAELQVTELMEGTDGYKDYLAQVDDSLKDDVAYARFFDIKIMVEGKEFKPKAPVNVKVELDTETDKLGDEVKAVQIGDDQQVGVVTAQVEKAAVSFDADDLPVYGIIGTQTLTGHVMTANGESFTIEVTCGPEAKIPNGASLQATEILEGTPEYEDYLLKSNDALVAEATGDSEPAGEEGSGLLEESVDNIAFARFFDIKIVKDGETIEPKAPVQVNIHYDDAIELDEGEQIKAVHFAEKGTEVIDVNVEMSTAGVTDVQYMQDSFSVTGTVVRYLSEGWPENGDYVIVVKPFNENRYYAVKNDGEITSVQYNESTGKVTFTDLASLDETADYTWTISSSSSAGWKYVKSGSSYLDPRQEGAITTNKETVATYKGLLYKRTYHSGWPMGYYTYDYLQVDETSLTIGGQGTGNDSNRAIVMLAQDFEVDEVPEPTPDPNSEYDLGAPVVSKSLNPNDDGTYQLALSVTGKSHAMENHTKADILVIFDTSGSMDANRMSTAKTALNGLADQLFANNTVEHPDTVRMKLLTFSNVVRSKSKGNRPENYYDDFAWVTGSVSGDTVNTGASSFKANVNSLNSSGNGGTNWEDALQVAAGIEMRADAARYVIFVSDGNPTFRNTKGTYWPEDSNNDYHKIYGVYGTGSESNGTIVTRCYENARDDAQALVDAGMNFYTIAVFGDVDRMNNLTAYAYSGNDGGTYPDGHYQNANNKEALNAAFDSIVSDIRADFKYTKVEINDGITNLTARALVEGVPNNYQYGITYTDAADNEKKSVNVTKNADGTVSIPSVTYTYLDTEGSEKTVTTDAVTLKGASYDGNTVNWQLDRSNGSNYKLESGWTYEVSFTVWPTQRAYDLVADLANGTQRYSQLSAEDKAAIDQASLTLKTNTSASVSYRQIKSKNGTDEAPSAAKTVDIPNPPGVPLIGSDLRIVKRWNDSLDPDQLLDLLTSKLRPDGTVDYSVRLDVTQDKGTSRRKSVVTADYPDGFLFQPQVVVEGGEVVSAEWPTIDIAVAPGVMVSEAEAHRLGLDTATDAQGHAKYETIEFDGVTYYVLEAGHRYEITEASVDYHFEMMSDVDHLMIVDGVLKNLIMDAEGNILSMSDNSENLTELGATNSLKGGIDLTKVVKDTQGREVTPTEDTFTVQCQLLDKDGHPYTRTSEEVGNDESDGIIYRVYADSDDTLEDVYPGKVEAGKSRTNKIGVLNSKKFEVKLKAGWTIRFINVPSGTTYSFTEVKIPDGYELKQSETTGTSGTAEVNAVRDCTVTNTMKNRQVSLLKIQMGTESAENPVVLDGVKFVLKRQANGGYQYLSRTNNETAWVDDKDEATEFTTDEQGTVSFGALPLDTYYLEETLPKAGYMLPAGDVIITVDADGVRYRLYEGAQPQVATGGQVVVPNSTGTELPNTGGVGTATLYAIGALLIGIASVGLARKKVDF